MAGGPFSDFELAESRWDSVRSSHDTGGAPPRWMTGQGVGRAKKKPAAPDWMGVGQAAKKDADFSNASKWLVELVPAGAEQTGCFDFGRCPSPRVGIPSGLDILRLNPTDWAARFNGPLPLVGGTPAWRQYIRAAWALMMENTDVVRWIACMLTKAPSGFDDCMVQGIVADRPTLDLSKTIAAGNVPRLCGTQACGLIGNRIVVVRDHTSAQTLMGNWAGAWTAAGKLCAAISLARVFIHELAHARCGRHHPPGGGSWRCDTSSLVGNASQWALAQRYRPWLEGCGNCFSSLGGPTVFTNTANTRVPGTLC